MSRQSAEKAVGGRSRARAGGSSEPLGPESSRRPRQLETVAAHEASDAGHDGAADGARVDSLDPGVGWVIAQRVREYRNQLGLTVEQLASAISVPLTSLFRGLEEEHDALLVRAGQGVEIVRKGTRVGHRYELLGEMRGPNKVVEPMLVTLNEHSEVFPLFQHPGIEFIYMLEGTVEYGYGADRYKLGPGDALQFSGEIVHGPTELVELPIKFLSVIAYGSPRR
jgi:quercetin dioxygenase-like cupin family protein